MSLLATTVGLVTAHPWAPTFINKHGLIVLAIEYQDRLYVIGFGAAVQIALVLVEAVIVVARAIVSRRIGHITLAQMTPLPVVLPVSMRWFTFAQTIRYSKAAALLPHHRHRFQKIRHLAQMSLSVIRPV